MDINAISPLVPTPVFNQIPSVIEKFQINSPLRLSHFLGQVAHESGNFNYKIENLNYGSDGLSKTFPKYFNSDTAAACQRNPEKIANRVYANRMGNGDEASGDGFKFRGRGFLQITGKSNYVEFDKAVPENIIDNPNLIADKYPLFSAAWFWDSHKLNPAADEGIGHEAIIKITKVINGGTIGLDDRIKRTEQFYNLLK
jgi:putative chitinase